jgi:hypothetical protein
MQFIEMPGKVLFRVVGDEGVSPEELRAAGVTDDSLVRVNPQGDIELRKRHRWEIIGGLLGDFAERVKAETGYDWA